MKKLVVVIFVLLFAPLLVSAAPFVACDPSPGVADSRVSVDGVIYDADICTYFVDADGDAILMNWEDAIPPIPPGMHTIRAEFIDSNGIGWGWSDPLDAESLGKAGNVKLKQRVAP